MTRPWFRFLAALAVMAAIGAACGDDDTSTAPGTSTTTTEAASTTTEPATTTTAAVSTTTTTDVPSGSGVPDIDLPGEAFALKPGEGTVIAVVGVRFDDVLNVRRVPGTDAEIVAELGPTAADATATGRARALSRSIWWEVVTAEGDVGWVGSSFTAQIGPTFDTTAALLEELGERPEAATMTELGRIVAETIDRDPDVPTTITETVEADESGDLGEVTFDVVGLGDDAVRGVRVHVFGEPLGTGAGFALRTVEATDLCDPVRGPSEPGGICA